MSDAGGIALPHGDLTGWTARRWLLAAWLVASPLAAGCTDTKETPRDAVIDASDSSAGAPADGGPAPASDPSASAPARLDVAALLEPIRSANDVPALGALMHPDSHR